MEKEKRMTDSHDEAVEEPSNSNQEEEEEEEEALNN